VRSLADSQVGVEERPEAAAGDAAVRAHARARHEQLGDVGVGRLSRAPAAPQGPHTPAPVAEAAIY
jgi:hypothetical protein